MHADKTAQTNILFQLDPHLDWHNNAVKAVTISSDLVIDIFIAVLTSHPLFDEAKTRGDTPRCIYGEITFPKISGIGVKSLEMEVDIDDDDGRVSLGEIDNVFAVGNFYTIQGSVSEIVVCSMYPRLSLSAQ